LRILFNTIRTDNLVTLNVLHYLELEVAKQAECMWSGRGWENHVPGEPIDDTVRRLYGGDPPDFIVDNNADLAEYRRLAESRTEDTPRMVMTVNDMHLEPEEWVRVANDGFSGALMRYLYCPYVKRKILSRFDHIAKFSDTYYVDNLRIPYLHFPWFTDEHIYGPSEEKDYDVVFLGSYRRRVYPIRYDVYMNLPKYCREHGYRYLVSGRPPGKTPDRNITDLEKQSYIVGGNYARTVARSKIFIFGSSIFNYPVSKYFEVMGSGTLVMADKPQTGEKLHFEPSVNYVEISKGDWREKLRYYLEDDEERERIARNGYETVKKYHSSKVRARQLVDFLRTLDS
jgi:hypothetical protein